MSDNSIRLISEVCHSINRFLTDELRARITDDLGPSHSEIVAGLLYCKAMTMTELSRYISRDRSTVTTLVQKLSNNGLVTLCDNPEDGRSRFVTLTDKGLALHDPLEIISTRLAETMWREVSRERRHEFEETLLHIIRNFENPA